MRLAIKGVSSPLIVSQNSAKNSAFKGFSCETTARRKNSEKIASAAHRIAHSLAGYCETILCERAARRLRDGARYFATN